MIIGLTATMSSGKGELANLLKKKGYELFVCSDIIKEEAQKRSIEPTRESLQNLGKEMKRRYPSILSKIILQRAKTENIAIDGLRNRAEINELKKHSDFILIAVTAPQRLRYKRLKQRARPGDPKTFKEFKRLDNKENRGSGAQEINKCIRSADYIINNTGAIRELENKLDNILKLKLSQPSQRPSSPHKAP